MSDEICDSIFYILNELNACELVTCDVWARWHTKNRERVRIKQESIGDYWVSTVFVGMSTSYRAPRDVFETRVFYKSTNLWAMRFNEFNQWEQTHRLGVGEALERLGK